jgi:antibiotic biosynthesis monooxygenase (ABM) superfamily enzyme
MATDNNRELIQNRDELPLETPVTTVIQQRPKPNATSRYEDWLKEIIPVAQQFAGHRGVNVIRPQGGSDAYTIVLHFDTIANLNKWLSSDIRRRLIEKIQPFMRADEDVEIKTGFEFWFTPPPGRQHAAPYKQFLITLSAIFPLTVIIPWLLQPVFAWLPVLALPIVNQLVVGVLIVGLMTWAIMPYYTRLVSRWLYG